MIGAARRASARRSPAPTAASASTLAAASGATLVVRAGGFAENAASRCAQRPAGDRARRRPGFSNRSRSRPRAPSSGWATCPPASASSTRSRFASRRPRWPTTCCAWCRPSACSGGPAACGASDGAGRVAARHRAERRQPVAGADRRRAVQRPVRRLGLLDARAARERGPHRAGGRHELQRLRQLRDGRRDQRHERPAAAAARSSCARSTATRTARRPTSSPATCGARWACRSRAAPSRPTGSRRSSPTSAGRWTRKATVDYRNFDAEAGLQPDRRASACSAATATSARSATTPRSRRSARRRRRPTTRRGSRERRRPRHAAGHERPAGARLHRPRDVPQQLHGGGRRAASDSTPRFVGRMTLLQEVPTDRRRASWRSGPRRSSSRHLFSAGADCRRVDGASLEQGLDAAARAPP